MCMCPVCSLGLRLMLCFYDLMEDSFILGIIFVELFEMFSWSFGVQMYEVKGTTYKYT
jgi:hypothetical protein